ncbi:MULTISPECIES: flagellar basal-body MS-ring/collar protein FliF [unclassified Paenibacillus]|uniref:flagellar basal-body MS-ring/collar protein FliF n=1 Tax=unclassified Paenibacillus TaxID=185978 RepID=UPI0004F6423D|nr:MULTISPECIES: flagellar basal-body MS-ring/collar protein FliF [unclassified Paenibacillus]AIQ30520.1 flagellar M-ring protein FliF [Paenibacillus sp. FSL P4-0081]OMF23662.1 flagellar M-ring protein FliF [Paenibacillus sp. FSL H8-0259]
MNERLAQYREKITLYWNRFSGKQKILFFSTLFIIIIIIVVLTMQLSKTEYEVAFQDLDSTDSAGVMTYLDTSGIPYRLSPDGKSISVPSTDAARIKIAIGSQGIVQEGSIGYKVFDESSSMIGTTDSEFNVKYNNALNGEVEQLMRRMQGIKDVKVLITLPKETVFASQEDQEKALASVVLSFNPGFRPTQDNIDGYFNLVKTAVPNLPVDNITITNNEVELMPTSKGGQAGVSSQVEENFALQKKFEDDVKKDVKQFLSTLTGPDKVDVLVFSKLNFDKENRQEEIVLPVDAENMKGIEISSQIISNTYSGQGNTSGGVAGTGSEDVSGYPSGTDSGTSSSEESSETRNYEVNRITKDIIASPYTVKDLTINVAVEPPNGQTTLDDTTSAAIQNILVNIVRASLADSGITYTDADLTKKVSVFSQQFGSTAADAASGGLANWMIWAIGGAALLVGAGGGYLIYRSRKNKQEEEAEDDIPLQVPTEFPSINMESVTNESQVRKQLESLAKKKPDEFVNLLRTWLAEEQR